jgi:hypothetical protein
MCRKLENVLGEGQDFRNQENVYTFFFLKKEQGEEEGK